MAEKGENVINLLLRTKPAKMLVNLKEKEWTISSLARASGCTYVYATKVLHRLERVGIVTITKKRKYSIVSLTDDGVMIASHIDEIFRRLEKLGSEHGQGEQ